MPHASVTTNGRITIPIEIRRTFGLKPGDRVDFVIDRPGEVRLRPKKTPLASLLGILHHPDQKAVTVEQMNEAVETQAFEDWQRIQSREQ